jgi:transcriptional regulator with XRE-family HTH domain
LFGYPVPRGSRGTVATMVTRIYQNRKGRLYLREHRKAKGVSAAAMAGRIGMARESVLRMEKRATAKEDQKAAYAAALDIPVEDLSRPPGLPSLDALVANEPPEFQIMAFDIVKRLVAKGG